MMTPEERIKAIRQVLIKKYESAPGCLDLWATYPGNPESLSMFTQQPHTHADYDHYIQDCKECQAVWIKEILKASEEVFLKDMGI
jgi:hypothetical protein